MKHDRIIAGDHVAFLQEEFENDAYCFEVYYDAEKKDLFLRTCFQEASKVKDIERGKIIELDDGTTIEAVRSERGGSYSYRAEGARYTILHSDENTIYMSMVASIAAHAAKIRMGL